MNKYLLAAILIVGTLNLQALRIHPLFTDHMVLQKGEYIPVWGWAEAGEEIILSLDTVRVKTYTKKNGSWEAVFPPIQQPRTNLQLTVSSRKQQIVLDHIAIGDVWLCAGQSNMAFQLYRSKTGDTTLRNRTDYDIRHFRIPPHFSEEPLETHLPAYWETNLSEELKYFSAVGYYFAEKIASKKEVPIGLINIAVGGSAIEAWMGESCFPGEWLDHYRDSIQKLEAELASEVALELGYTPEPITAQKIFHPAFSFKQWKEMNLPGRWEDMGYSYLDGLVYFAKDLWMPQIAAPQEPVILHLPSIDDADSVWVNGNLIGATRQWNVSRHYSFSGSALKKGKNRIVIQVKDTGGSGGIRGSVEEMYLEVGGKKFPLAGNWKFYISELQLDSPWKKRHQPALCHNAMLHPITRFPIKGIIWYQGESNATTDRSAREYGEKFIHLINNWREKYHRPSLPFLFVQLPGYDASHYTESTETWAWLRQSQLEALKLSNTACASIIDLGEKKDIHPVYKKEVGVRLADIALQTCYGDTGGQPLSPQLDTYQFVNDGIILYFKQAGKGLILRSDSLSSPQYGIELLDKNRRVQEADLTITSPNTVKVTCKSINKVQEIKYLWKNWNEHIPLFSKNGLPVMPFYIKL